MSNKNLFKEAIADAKAVREAALANAKAALEEALTPKLQSMLAAKLNEMEELEEDDSYEEDGTDMEEGFVTNQFNWNDEDNSDTDQNKLDESEELEEDFDLSEILAELDEDYSLEEGKDDDEDEDKKKKKKKNMMKEAEEAEETEETEEEEVADMTVEDLKALIKDIVNQEMEAEEAETPADEESEEAGDEMPMDTGSEESSDEVDLEELLAELDALHEGEDEEDNKKKKLKMKKKGLAEDYKSISPAWLSAKIYGTTEDIITGCRKASKNSDEYYACLEAKGVGFSSQGTARGASAAGGNWEEFGKTGNEFMSEAVKTINTLRSELNEVNLLNAKLLYVNKIFKAKNLSESQKLQVIASFDKATTAKEAKVVYESLNSTLKTTAPKQAIKESLGFASKAAGVAPKKAIVESNDVITRMQKLANIIK